MINIKIVNQLLLATKILYAVYICVFSEDQSMESLFPQHGGTVQQQAGKCNLVPQGRNFLVTPDLQKGLITLSRTNDNLISFQWSDRSSNTVDTALILFPDDVDFKRVNTGRNDERVYMLKWRTGGKVLMFWMQDKSSTKDSEYCSKVNEFINNPRAAVDTNISNPNDNAAGNASPANATRRPEAPRPAPPAFQPSLLGNLDLSSLLQGVPSQPPVRAPTAPSSTPALTSEQLARTLAALSSAQAQPQNPALQDILTADAVIGTGLLDDPEAVHALADTMPEGQQTPQHVAAALRSPQLRQTLAALSDGLDDQSYGSVLANFGLDPVPASDLLLRGDAVGAFIASVQAAEDACSSAAADAGSPADSCPQESKEEPMDQD